MTIIDNIRTKEVYVNILYRQNVRQTFTLCPYEETLPKNKSKNVCDSEQTGEGATGDHLSQHTCLRGEK